MQTQTYSKYLANTTDLFATTPIVFGSFGERLGAIIIDILVLLIPHIMIRYMLAEVPALFLTIIVDWLYFSIQECSMHQATIGKRAVGIKVATTDGDRITFYQATGRYFGKVVSSLILMIGYFMVLWEPKRQALHDKMASTVVVKY